MDFLSGDKIVKSQASVRIWKKCNGWNIRNEESIDNLHFCLTFLCPVSSAGVPGARITR
jgi:hypothetical protein